MMFQSVTTEVYYRGTICKFSNQILNYTLIKNTINRVLKQKVYHATYGQNH